MVSKKSRTEVREKMHSRLRNHLAGTAERPRFAVFRSNNHMYNVYKRQAQTNELNVFDALKYDKVVVTKAALATIEEVYA